MLMKVQVIFEPEGKTRFHVCLLVLFETHSCEHGRLVLWQPVAFISMHDCDTYTAIIPDKIERMIKCTGLSTAS